MEHNDYTRIFIRDIAESERIPHSDAFRFLDKVVMRVMIVGVLVGLENKSRYVGYTVDDGSEIIQANDWNIADSSKWDVGHLISIRGRVSFLSDIRQLTIDSIDKATHLDEIIHWKEILLSMKTYHENSKQKSQLITNKSFKKSSRSRFDWRALPPSRINSTALKLTIMQYLLEIDMDIFSNKIIMNSKDIVSCANAIRTSTESPSDLMTKALMDMYEEGFIIPIDSSHTRWERIGTHNLGMSIIQILNGEGMSLSSLAKRLKISHIMYSKVTDITLRKTLKQLEKKGGIARRRVGSRELWYRTLHL